MGATLSSHSLTDEKLRALITEYTKQSLKTVEECWRIFVDEAHSERSLSYAQFDEVFGMLVKDTEPHFKLFERQADGKNFVNGYEVLVGICLALRVDIKRKLHFIFRMYVSPNHENFIESNMKLVIYRDFMNSVTSVLKLTEGPSTEKSNAMEVTLRGTEESKPYITLKEAIEFSLTHPLVCAFFEELQVLFTGLVSVDKVTTFFQRPGLLEDTIANLVDGKNVDSNDPDILWATKIRDIGGKTFYNEDIFYVPDDLHCFLALKEMQLRNREFAIVYERNRVTKNNERVYIGLLDYETFARCLLHAMPPMEVHCKSTGSYLINVAKLSDSDLAKMEPQIAEAGRKYASMTLKEVLKITQENNDFLPSSTKKPSLRVSYGDDCLFNLVHRFASFDNFVPIVHDPKNQFPILGVLTSFDIVRFILQDLSILNGKQFIQISKLNCLYKPLCMHRSSASIYEAFHVLRSKHMTGMLLLSDNDDELSTFGWQDILELVESWPSKLNFVANINYPVNLPPAITPTVSLPHFSNLVFPLCHVLKTKQIPQILPTDSVAKVLTTFWKLRVTRLYIVEADQSSPIGVIRLVDMMRLLLNEQKHSYKKTPS